MIERELNKHQRLQRICHLLYRNPHGLTTAEIARLCGVSVRTAQRDLQDLQEEGVPLWEGEGRPPRYGIAKGYYVPPIHLGLDDALALFLAARLLARYADTFDPHIAEALAKLAGILPEGMAEHIHATIRALASRREAPRFVEVLRVLALGWASRRRVRIRHQAAGSAHVHEYTLSPYFIEPSATGNATYVIGHASFFDGLRTFKVERILSAELTDEAFEVPEGFDGPALLAGAWGIWYGEEPQEVALHFVPEATRRVKETCWHPSQTLEELPDGGCILSMTVDAPEEMIYWIRGWGPQVEVLAPAWLRERMEREAREVVRIYEGLRDGGVV
ncbi:MAG: WYL domain-containing protein [Chloroflexi bacterium]|nr:WYL domain-containing protein [Chloroflexota bacterium]